MIKNKNTIISLILVTLSVIMVIIFFTTFIILLNNYKTLTAIIMCVSYILTFVFSITSTVYSNNYQWKYIFLRKNFYNEKNKFLKNHNNLSKKEKNKIIKKMKDTYRKTGSIYFAVNDYILTPYKLFFEQYGSFNYEDSNDKQKMEYLIHLMYLFGDYEEVYLFVESFCDQPFTYEEYTSLIKNCNLLSNKLKNTLLCPTFKIFYNFFKKENLSQDERESFYLKHNGNENLLFNHNEEICNLVEKISIKNYLEYKQKDKLPNNTTKLFISKDGYIRFIIFYENKTKSFKIKEEEFVFFNYDNPLKHSEGDWISSRATSSFFGSEELALNDIKNELNDFIEINLK